jgi:U3 small nucleolar RNA-associated protein 6
LKFLNLYLSNCLIQALKFYASQRKYFDKLVEISVVSLARDGGSESGFSLSSAIVSFILEKDGIHKARDIYKRYVKWNQLAMLFANAVLEIFYPASTIIPQLFVIADI